jgi:hypothetical protein
VTNSIKVCNGLLALKQECIHPTTKQTYIKSSVGGRENSPEGHQGGVTHVFISEFENDEDRKYYLEKDPAHLAFVKSLDGVVNTVRVVDFTPGVF